MYFFVCFCLRIFLPNWVGEGWGGWGLRLFFLRTQSERVYADFFFTLPALHMYIHVCPGLKHGAVNILETALVQANECGRQLWSSRWDYCFFRVFSKTVVVVA